MKKIFLMIVLCFGVFSLTQAQQNTTQSQAKPASSKTTGSDTHVDRQAQQLKKTLTLNDSQTSQAKVIYKKYMDKETELKSQAKKAGKDVDQKQLNALKTQQNNEIEALLTKDQKTKFESSMSSKSGKTDSKSASKKTDPKGGK